MVQPGKKTDTPNDTTKSSQSNMSFQRKDMTGAGKNEGRQNGNASSFRTDTAISGNRTQGERPLQRWVPDGPPDTLGSLESGRMNNSGGGAWDQFEENERRFGVKTDYDENIYTTTINKKHPQYKQRLAEAERKAREIERSAANNSHVAEERIVDNLAGEENGVDEEDKYSGVRRQQDFPPLTSSNNNRYTPPARRAPTGSSTVSGAPVDPAIISSQLARPDKPVADKGKAPAASAVPKTSKAEVSTPPTTTESSVAATPEPKAPAAAAGPSSRTASPQVKADGVPNATATVERDVASAFKGFAAQQRKNVEAVRQSRARNDKEIKLNDLKKFADSFKLTTPVPSDLVPIIAKDPAKQKEIQEKAKRNAEENKANPSEGVKPIPPPVDMRAPQRTVAATHGTSPANVPSRQNPPRNSGFAQQSAYRGSSQAPQPSAQQNRPAPGLGGRLRSLDQNKVGPSPPNPIPAHEARQPPTGPANGDSNFSRRSSGVTSAQGARLNPTIGEFRPSPHAASFNPVNNQSNVSSPRSTVNAAPPAPITRSLLRRKPIPESERPSFKAKFNSLDHIKTIKPAPEKNWSLTGGLKPAYETPVLWKTALPGDKPDSAIHMTYARMFELAPFPAHTISPAAPPHAIPQVPHQHQLPFHLQQNVHNPAVRQSPRQAPMNLHGNQMPHGPAQPFNGHDDHRMMPSHSAQSFASPRMQHTQMQYQSPMNQNAQMAYNPQMMPFPNGPPMQQQFRSMSNSHQYMPQPGPMGPIMMPNPSGMFMTSQGIPPGVGSAQMFPQGSQGGFMPPTNGMPPQMPGVNGFPSPGRGGAMMMNQGSQQGHQPPPPMYGMNPGMNPGMSPGPQYVNTAQGYNQHPPPNMGMRGYGGGPNQFGTSPQQMHQFGPQQQHRNNHSNGNYNKNFQPHGQHQNGPANNQIPTGPQARTSEGNEESK
ncbi:hypothetical protein ONS96_005128 [Cadophora gregata f. sp. sojae]|nr:hypothetical protein ONS96_005128 [Cadophora gregata f. sp. sojae]